jgi:hypothetical protein
MGIAWEISRLTAGISSSKMVIHGHSSGVSFRNEFKGDNSLIFLVKIYIPIFGLGGGADYPALTDNLDKSTFVASY